MAFNANCGGEVSVSITGRLVQTYFNLAYNRVYDFTTARLSRYDRLQRTCIGKLELKDNDKVLCVGLGTGNEVPKILQRNRNVAIVGVDYSKTALGKAYEKARRWGKEIEVLFMDAHCLLSPTLDVDRHIAALVKKLECPVGSERDVFMCPCRKVEGEIEKDGHTSCGIFVTERQVQQVNQLQSSKEKTKGLLKRYKDLEG